MLTWADQAWWSMLFYLLRDQPVEVDLDVVDEMVENFAGELV